MQRKHELEKHKQKQRKEDREIFPIDCERGKSVGGKGDTKNGFSLYKGSKKQSLPENEVTHLRIFYLDIFFYIHSYVCFTLTLTTKNSNQWTISVENPIKSKCQNTAIFQFMNQLLDKLKMMTLNKWFNDEKTTSSIRETKTTLFVKQSKCNLISFVRYDCDTIHF